MLRVPLTFDQSTAERRMSGSHGQNSLPLHVLGVLQFFKKCVAREHVCIKQPNQLSACLSKQIAARFGTR